MARVLQLRRGTNAENNLFTGAAGELTVDTTNEVLRIHDGATQGGTTVGLDAGFMAPFAGTTAPDGWLICDGSAVSRTDYARLFSVIGTTYGAGDGNSTFNLPDYSGAKIITKNNSDVITGGNTLTSPAWYNADGDTYIAAHYLLSRSNGQGTDISSQTISATGNTYTKLQVDLTNQPSLMLCIKY